MSASPTSRAPRAAQRVGAVETVDRAAKVVGARVGDDGDRAAGRAAELGVEALARDAELAHCILAQSLTGQTAARAAEIDPVDHVDRLRAVGPCADDRRTGAIEVLDAIGLNPRREQREPFELAVDHRQLANLFRGHVGGGFGAVNVHQRRLTADLEAFFDLRAKAEPEPCRVSDPKRQALDDRRFETGELGADPIVTRGQCCQQHPAELIGHAAAFGARLGVDGHHGDARQWRSVADHRVYRQCAGGDLRRKKTRTEAQYERNCCRHECESCPADRCRSGRFDPSPMDLRSCFHGFLRVSSLRMPWITGVYKPLTPPFAPRSPGGRPGSRERRSTPRRWRWP